MRKGEKEGKISSGQVRKDKQGGREEYEEEVRIKEKYIKERERNSMDDLLGEREGKRRNKRGKRRWTGRIEEN